MSPVTTVIFDMYQTLAENNSGHWLDTFEKIVQEQGLEIDPSVLRQVWQAQGRQFSQSRITSGAEFLSYFQSWCAAFTEAFRELALVGDAVAASKLAIMEHCQRPLFPETKQVLARIGRLVRTAVASNADDDFLKPNLNLAGLEFEQVISSEEARSYKPQPDLFLEIMRRLNVSPEECLYVGDRQFEDVKGAGGVGMGTVWVNRSGDPLDADLPTPDYQIANLLELPEILKLPELP